MFGRLILLFVLVPLVDLVILLSLARVHWLLTVLLILLTGLLGAVYVRRQGWSVLSQLKRSLAQAQMPTEILFEGALLLFAAALLITPGLITDAIGLSMLFRPCRRWYRDRFIRWIKPHVTLRTYSTHDYSDHGSVDPNILDAQVVGRREDMHDSSEPASPPESQGTGVN